MLHVSHYTTLAREVNFLTLLHFRDNVAARTLTSVGYTDTKNMTVENCVDFCNTQNFVYAGVEYGQECCKWCSALPIALFLPHLRYSDHTISDIRLWECHIQWWDDRFGFGL